MRKASVLGLVAVLLLALAAVPVSASGGKTRMFTILFQSQSLPADAAKLVEKAGGRVISSVPEIGMIQAEGTTAMMTALQKNSSVQAVAPTLTWSLETTKMQELTESTPDTTLNGPGDLYNAYQWDIKQVTHNGASWQLGGGSHQTVVGIIDTGVNKNHSALAANFMGGRNFVPAGANGDPTETGDPNDFADRHGHGSHVAGTIAGNGRIYGVGPNLGFRSYRVFGATGGAPTSWIVAAMVSAVNDGVDVISMSLGGYDVQGKVTWTDPDTGTTYKVGDDHPDMVAWMRATKYALSKDVVVVAAAGNEGFDAGNPKAVVDYLNAEYGSLGFQWQGAGREVPGNLPGVIAVSATGPDESPASYSNYGNGFVSVAAPGGDFQRYPVGDWYTDMCLSSYKTSGYVWMAGTSMATPKVSAVAALVIDQYKTSHGGARPGVQYAPTKIAQSAVDLGKPGHDAYYGQGELDAYAALGGQ